MLAKDEFSWLRKPNRSFHGNKKTLLHTRNLANDTRGGGTLIYDGVKLERGGKIGLKQSLIYIHPFPPLSRHTTYFPLHNSVPKRKLFWGPEKKLGVGAFAPQVRPMCFCIYTSKNDIGISSMVTHIAFTQVDGKTVGIL